MKETFAESGSAVFNTFLSSLCIRSLSKYITHEGLSRWNILKLWNFALIHFFCSNCVNKNCFIEMDYYERKAKQSGKYFFPARSPVTFKIFKSEKVYVNEMQKCCNFTKKIYIS